MLVQPSKNMNFGGGGGLLGIKSNSQIDAMQQAQIDREEADAGREMAQFESALSAHIRTRWQEAYQAKQPVHEQMLKCLRQRKGEYDPVVKAEIAKTGGADLFMMLTDVKCRAAEAWINDVLNAQDEVWGLEPTAEPTLSPEQEQAMFEQAAELIMSGMFAPEEAQGLLEDAKAEIKQQLEKQAKDAAARMTKKIYDQWQEGGFETALKEFVSDVVTFPGGVIKGPILRRTPRLSWGEGFKPVVTEEITAEVSRISPFDVYPGAHASGFNDGDLCVRHRLTNDSLYKMIGVRGNKEEAIRTILRESRGLGYTGWLESSADAERDRLEGKDSSWLSKGGYIEALEYRGSAPGSALIEWGMDRTRIDDAERSYEIEAWLIGRHVVRCVLNGDPLGRKPFSKANAIEVPGAFWGMCVSIVMNDTQIICNTAVRALADNIGMASGPQVGVDPNAIPPGESLTSIYPWKIWQLHQSPNGNGVLPLQFFQPQMHAQELIGIFDRFSRQADEVTGIPAYAYGSDSAAGAGKTASGLSMLMNATSKGIRAIISNIDVCVRELMNRFFVYNMLYDPDMSIKGDSQVVSKGAVALIQKETLQMRRMEMLQYTANPIDMEIIGVEGRAKMLREAFKTLEYGEDIIPDGPAFQAIIAKIEQRRMMLQQGQASNSQQGGPVALDPAGAPQGAPPGDLM